MSWHKKWILHFCIMKVAVLGVHGLVGEAFSRNFPDKQLLLSRDDLDFNDIRQLSLVLKSHDIDT